MHSPPVAAFIAAATPLVSISGRLGAGWLGDKTSKIMLTAGALGLMGLGLLFFSYITVDNIWMTMPYIILYGVGWGGIATQRAPLLREYFGRGSIGTILGFMMGMLALGNIVGPYFAGWIYDTLGSYHSAWLIYDGLIFAAMVIMATTPKFSALSRQAPEWGEHG